MKEHGFYEDFESSHADPMDSQCCDFDYDAVERALGNIPDEDDYEKLGRMFVCLAQWLSETRLQAGADRVMGRRALAMAWVVLPGLFDGLSIGEIARRIETKPATLSHYTSEFSKLFKIANRGQAHGWNRGLKRTPKSTEGEATVTT